MRENVWTREQTLVAFNLYCKIPFKSSHRSHPLVVKYAEIIGRSPSALNMKIGNIGRLDPELKKNGMVGLSHGGKMEADIWAEFCENWEGLAYESERLVAEFSQKSIEVTSGINLDGIPTGEEREAIVRQRVGQSFFRNAVLSSYNYRCCITGLSCDGLVEACHISEWAADVRNRLNPANGLSMNPLFHKAYDKYYMSITPDCEVVVSDFLKDASQPEEVARFFSQYDKRKIMLPDKFFPNRELLDLHHRRFLDRWR